MNKELLERIEDLIHWLDGGGASQDADDIEKLLDLVPKELKHKKEIPTVIEYMARRYVLDDRLRK